MIRSLAALVVGGAILAFAAGSISAKKFCPGNSCHNRTATPTVATATETPTWTSTPVASTTTSTPTISATNTSTPTSTDTATLPATASASATRTFTAIPSATTTSTPTKTAVPTATSTATPQPSSTPSSILRDKYVWPCASNSIWNQPIGSGARYAAAGLTADANGWNNGAITTDTEIINLDPVMPLKTLNGGPQVHVRPDQNWSGGWNGVAAFLNADGNRVEQGQPLVLAAGGNPSWQYNYGSVDIKGDCISGAHGGSALSSFGGSLREGELTSTTPIHHALKINVYAKRFLSCTNGGFRWPAPRADGYESCTTYGGTTPVTRMGALIALRPVENCSAYSAGPAQKICHALQDYGAYIVDDTFWNVYAIDGTISVESLPAQFARDVQDMMSKAAVIDNNASDNIGGGGLPRAPIAPPFSN